jgi:hypothetical protein
MAARKSHPGNWHFRWPLRGGRVNEQTNNEIPNTVIASGQELAAFLPHRIPAHSRLYGAASDQCPGHAIMPAKLVLIHQSPQEPQSQREAGKRAGHGAATAIKD